MDLLGGSYREHPMYPFGSLIATLIVAGYFDEIPVCMFLFVAILFLIYISLKPRAPIRAQAVRAPR